MPGSEQEWIDGQGNFYRAHARSKVEGHGMRVGRRPELAPSRCSHWAHWINTLNESRFRLHHRLQDRQVTKTKCSLSLVLQQSNHGMLARDNRHCWQSDTHLPAVGVGYSTVASAGARKTLKIILLSEISV